DAQAKRLADVDRTGKHCAPLSTCTADDLDGRLLLKRHEVVAGDRIGQDMELEVRLGESLDADAGRAMATIADTNGYRVAFAQEIAHNLDMERAVPRSHILLGVEPH